MLLRNDAVFRRDVIGMPVQHAEQFGAVAAAQQVIIISRATGPTCLQLLEEGYDTKGFRIHAKSCTWGPMAGFVMRDPRLNKKGLANAEYNRHEHHTAMQDTSNSGWKASTTPLKLSEERIRWLAEKNIIRISGMGPGIYRGKVLEPVTFDWVLKREPGESVFTCYVDNSGTFRQETGSSFLSTKYAAFAKSGRRPRLEPLLAMTNPPDHRSYPEGNYLNAVTGDYDLFAVWPRAASYDPLGQDQRVFGTVRVLSRQGEIDDMEADFVDGMRQGTKLGNLTDRIYLVSQLLNSAIGSTWTKAGGGWKTHSTRMVCWHSTESARPYVTDVDLPIIAFMPDRRGGYVEVGVESLTDFKALILQALNAGFRPLLAEGWVLEPEPGKENRLGGAYGHLVPDDVPGGRMRVPSWYNR